MAASFIRVVEVWVPDEPGSLLVLGSAHYGAATRFGASSQRMCFGRGEGLPGRAWEAGHPLVLKDLQDPLFRRAAAARADGLSCGIAVPVFAGSSADAALQAVLLIFCGDTPAGDEASNEAEPPQAAGAIELWHNAAQRSPDLLLADGYYGATGEAFEFLSRRTAFRRGTGLPGLAWASGLPVFMPDLGKGSRFLRADSAQQVGINRGFALPCNTLGPDTWVLAFLSALNTPLVQRFETWLPTSAPGQPPGLRLREGFCQTQGPLAGGDALPTPLLLRALATATPQVQAASASGSAAQLALPVLEAGSARVAAVVAWTL